MPGRLPACLATAHTWANCSTRLLCAPCSESVTQLFIRSDTSREADRTTITARRIHTHFTCPQRGSSMQHALEYRRDSLRRDREPSRPHHPHRLVLRFDALPRQEVQLGNTQEPIFRSARPRTRAVDHGIGRRRQHSGFAFVLVVVCRRYVIQEICHFARRLVCFQCRRTCQSLWQ